MNKYTLLFLLSTLFFTCKINKIKNEVDDLSLAKWEVYKGLYNFIDNREYIRCENRENNHVFMVEQTHKCPELVPHEIYIDDYLVSELVLESRTNKGDTIVFHFSITYRGKCIIPVCPIDSPNAVGIYKHNVIYIGFGNAIFGDSFDDKDFISYIFKNKKNVNTFLYKQAQQRHPRSRKAVPRELRNP